MSDVRVDLFLGGELGCWALEQAGPQHVGAVISGDEPVLTLARALGFRASRDLPESPRANFALSVHYPIILSNNVLGKYRAGYNLHPGYLPWGRGYYPVFWALFEGTPAGATLHQMTESLDAGPIVDQIRVPYTDVDTGGTLHGRVREAEKMLFRRHWPALCRGEPLPVRAQEAGGSYHARDEFFAIKQPRSLKDVDAEALIRRIRCLTFPGYTGLELEVGERFMHLAFEKMD